jgi:hypothetical protein
MQPLGTKLGVPFQHLPILVPGHERRLLDRQAGLEQAAGGLMAQIVEVQVGNAKALYGPQEGRAGKTPIP